MKLSLSLLGLAVFCLIVVSLRPPALVTTSDSVEMSFPRLEEWDRDTETALSLAATLGRPVLRLSGSSSHPSVLASLDRILTESPLLLEAIHSEFHPVLSTGNETNGAEPSFTVLGQGKAEAVIRLSADLSASELASALENALILRGDPVPRYLWTVAQEARTKDIGTVAFSMFCFWTGEQKLGGIPGVLTTEAGWLGGAEVTRVTYDRSELAFAELLEKALRYDCARAVFTANAEEAKIARKSRLSVGDFPADYRIASKSDQKRQIPGTRFASLVLNPIQATKVNAFARSQPQKALEWLSPSQVAQVTSTRD